MGYESDCYRDEAGKSLADLGGDAGSKPNEPQKHVLDVASERSPTPVGLKCRKLVVKIKPGNESGPVDFKLGGNGVPRLVRDDYSGGKNKKMEKGENRKSLGKKKNVEKGEKEPRVKKSGKQKMRDHDEDSEINEMWDAIAGGNSEVEFPYSIVSALHLFLLLPVWNYTILGKGNDFTEKFGGGV
ncbi:hypothetical protein C2S53_017196 [Perilla frutescens var. hirtella]|uniref:Uncharacterized protein n=1 Tax=Perilla frutescens var. hirtella TaxID=608512 RepID=A0AAD4NZL2_PERFH|nr:hypothetical protein C2S53_017196 [Perilla frutescens var. hirtella]